MGFDTAAGERGPRQRGALRKALEGAKYATAAVSFAAVAGCASQESTQNTAPQQIEIPTAPASPLVYPECNDSTPECDKYNRWRLEDAQDSLLGGP